VAHAAEACADAAVLERKHAMHSGCACELAALGSHDLSVCAPDVALLPSMRDGDHALSSTQRQSLNQICDREVSQIALELGRSECADIDSLIGQRPA